MTSLDTLIQNVMDQELTEIEKELESFKERLATDVIRQKATLDEEFLVEKQRMEQTAEEKHKIQMTNLSLKGRDARLQTQQRLLKCYEAAVKQAMQEVPADHVEAFIEYIYQNTDIEANSELVLGELTQAQLGTNYHAPLPLSADTLQGVAGFVIRSGSVEYDYTFNQLVLDTSRELQLLLRQEMQASQE
ncbi:hypothetical protein CL176_02740 [Suicoccus acidiformans]|uniref:V-type ATP synthase subunit E n=1 Tax=Suicoccus acidiformans TaxID=2036206 RepID=A0A347WIX2_9LACT|nr:hypothetical protein [Suicoccus acidiformans]AXY25029.1 hypothetical protein CL176_02740 [Suicoccus acidiformans]